MGSVCHEHDTTFSLGVRVWWRTLRCRVRCGGVVKVAWWARSGGWVVSVVVKLVFAHILFHVHPDASLPTCRPTLKCMFRMSRAQVCVESQELFGHLPSSVIARANMIRGGSDTGSRAQSSAGSTEGHFDAMCGDALDSGCSVPRVDGQWLGPEGQALGRGPPTVFRSSSANVHM